MSYRTAINAAITLNAVLWALLAYVVIRG